MSGFASSLGVKHHSMPPLSAAGSSQQAGLERLTAIWSGLPTCSVVVLRHLQKTAGSSIVKLFEDLQRDLQWSVSGYWTPCWRHRSVHVAQGRLRWLRGLRKLAQLTNGSADPRSRQSLLLDTPPWRLRMLLHVRQMRRDVRRQQRWQYAEHDLSARGISQCGRSAFDARNLRRIAITDSRGRRDRIGDSSSCMHAASRMHGQAQRREREEERRP